MRSYEEINSELMNHLRGEMDDILAYHQMAVELETMGCKECEFVMAIAKDEMLHANWIFEHLKKDGVTIPQDIMDRFHALESAHK